MIGQLRGRLEEKRTNQVLVDVGGVGYQVQIPLSTYAALGELHAEVTLLIYTHVREDQIALYGFLTAREKQMFELLLDVSGVGPSLALRILSGMAVDNIIPAVRQGDVAQLTRIPGVGKKTAERVVVELRDKVAAAEAPAAASTATGLEADVLSALLNLGYERRDAERVLESLRRDGSLKGRAENFESLLRTALQRLSPAPKQPAQYR